MSYTTDDIQQMDGITHARYSVGNALGSHPRNTGTREIVDNAFDEVVAGHATTVTIVLRSDGSVEVMDDGRGIPVDYHEKSKMNGICLTLGQTMSGGKFGDDQTSAGVNGIGASATNAISERFDVTVWRGGKEYHQSFHQGRPGHFGGTSFNPSAKFKRVDGERLRGDKPRAGAPKHGTAVRFVFDPTIARDDELSVDDVLFRARCSATMINGAKLVVANEGWPGAVDETLTENFSGPYGSAALLEFVTATSGGKSLPEATMSIEGTATFDNKNGDATCTYSMSAQPDYTSARVWGFVNFVYTPNGGNHVNAVTRGVGAAMSDRVSRLRGLGLQKGEEPPCAEDFAAVCSAAVMAIAPKIHFSGQSKDSIESRSLGNSLSKDIERKVSLWAAAPANSDSVTVWAKIALEYARTKRSVESARARARSKSQARSLGENLSLPDKLLPSRLSGRGSGAELYICEGDSARGTIKNARDSSFQAVFPLKGKPMNVYNMTLAKARNNVEFDSIERILGCGAKDRCDPESCRYDRIMFASDADADGGNINSLLICMFLEFFRPLVKAGMVYVTMPPLFVVTQGEERVYCQSEDDRDVAVTQLKEKSSKKVEIHRNKGLGEMSEIDFWNTVLDPEQRTLMQLNIGDEDIMDKLNYTLFGGPAAGRRDWISNVSSRMDLADLDLRD